MSARALERPATERAFSFPPLSQTHARSYALAVRPAAPTPITLALTDLESPLVESSDIRPGTSGAIFSEPSNMIRVFSAVMTVLGGLVLFAMCVAVQA